MIETFNLFLKFCPVLRPEVAQSEYQCQNSLYNQSKEEGQANYVHIPLGSEQVGLVYLPGETINPMDTVLVLLPHPLKLPHLLEGA